MVTMTYMDTPTREEIRDMLNRPAVAITAMICAMIVVLGALGGIVYLAETGKGTEAIGGLLLGILGLVLGKLQTIKQQTNGTQTRLLDAALSTNGQPPAGSPPPDPTVVT